jgi:3-oxoacyl-[acyl-carrier protein] reductase
MAERKPVALVTGGSRGIGRGICLALASRGFNILINYNANADAAEQTKHMILKMGGEAETCQADIATAAHRELMLDYCMENLGRLDVLVNNAGIAPPQRADLLDMAEDSYDLVMETNLKGPFFLTQMAARLMVGQIENKIIESASIINISSISAYTASVNRGEYCMSKTGMTMMTALFAIRLAEYGINVYEVRPGIVRTDMTAGVQKKYDALIKDGLLPIRRWGYPEDVGKAVAALATGALPYSTGEVINVDGGFHLRNL